MVKQVISGDLFIAPVMTVLRSGGGEPQGSNTREKPTHKHITNTHGL